MHLVTLLTTYRTSMDTIRRTQWIALRAFYLKRRRALNYFLLFIATSSASGKAIFCKLVGSSRGKRSFFVNFEAFFAAFLVSLVFAAGELKNIGKISLFSVLLAVAFGFSVAFTQFTQMKAMNAGSPSMTTLIYSSAFLIPIVFSYFAWDNPISPWQIVGIIILLFALVRKDVIGALFPTAVSVSAICITITILLDCLMTFSAPPQTTPPSTLG